MARLAWNLIEAMATSKYDRHIIDISKFLQGLKEELLNVSGLKSKLSFQNFEEKNHFGGDIQYQSKKDIATKYVIFLFFLVCQKNTFKFNIFSE